MAISISGIAMRAYLGGVEPVLFRLRKEQRLRVWGLRAADLPDAALRLETEHCSGGVLCRHMVSSHRDYLAKYMRRGPDGIARLWQGTPCLLDLDGFADAEAYEKAIRSQSFGYILRETRKAAKAGYHCRIFDRFGQGDDMRDIEASKLFRSGGPVPQAFAQRFGRGSGVKGDPWLDAPCPEHWAVDWGVFIDDGRDRLVGTIVLRRIGNIIRIVSFLGHADHLSSGAMKLLFVEIVRWLLRREDLRVRGVRFVLYGALEQGGLGLLHWKRRLLVRPFVFADPVPAGLNLAGGTRHA
ncbi:hypothetical protein [Inquilinus sp.]|uniref:hypothetical protein n=1 Tax=Inquilinus sp. TaxID=1932117 RepID=UPI0031D1A780